MFEQNARVLCVNGNFANHVLKSGLHVPITGRIYTVRGVVENEEGVGLLLAEIFNRPVNLIGSKNFGKEPTFRVERFALHKPRRRSFSLLRAQP